ncbi:penicillin-binding protein, partial [Candidatus Roizmanbacteria bacterium]|nr:penicillin-binding protein [Candidatus Roizmanbacteria bacterium]
NGGILVTRPTTGEILAMVGSLDYFASPSGAFNVTTAQRQPGSSIKPLMYSLALERGYTAGTIIDDSAITFASAGGESYRPVNYDGRFHGKIPLRYALANSYNIPAVKVLSTVGVGNFVVHAQKMGISTWNDSSRFGLSLTLGGGEVTMVDMATAFSVFVNQGFRQELTGSIKIENQVGDSIFTARPSRTKVLNDGIAYIISDILADNVARGWAFGTNSSLEIPGYNKKDNWTIGYTPNFLTAVWVGNNDGTPMNPYLTSGITGAAPIWNRVMAYVLKNYSGGKARFEKPENVVEKKCYFGRTEYFIKGTENSVSCQAPTETPAPPGY